MTTRPSTDTPRPPVPHRTSTALLALGIPALIVAAGAALALSWRDELPSRVATHFGPSGEPDNFGPVLPHVVAPSIIVMVFALGLGAFGVLAGRTSLVRRVATALPTGFAVVLMWTIVSSLADQRGLADAAEARNPGGSIVLGVVLAIVLAVAVAAVTPGDRHIPTTEPVPPDAPRLSLGEHENAVWVRRVGQKGVALVGAAVLTLTVVLALVTQLWWPVLLGLVIGGALTAIIGWTVTVDGTGMTVRSLYRRPAVRVPLDEVVSAAAVEVSPVRDYGGWGLRTGRAGRVGVVVRKGAAIEVHRTAGRILVVTVDDAGTGAALLNTLAARARG